MQDLNNEPQTPTPQSTNPSMTSTFTEISQQTDNGGSQTITPTPPSPHKPVYRIKLILVLVFLLLLAAVGVLTYTKLYVVQPSSSKIAIITPHVSPHFVVTTTPPPPTQSDHPTSYFNTYTSEALGVTFTYAPEYAGQKAVVTEDDNKIFVGTETYQSQFIQIFTIENGASVTADMQQRFLSDYSLEDCRISTPVKPSDPNNVSGAYPIDGHYLVLNIEANVDSSQLDDYDAFVSAFQKCPRDYTRSNGVSYFSYDTRVPEKYIFYSIGQEPAWPANSDPNRADENLTWIQTIQFTNK